MGTNPISPKAKAGGVGALVGGGLAVLFWVIAVNTFWQDTFDESELALLITATEAVLAGVFAFIGAYLLPDPRRSTLSAHPDAIIRSYEQPDSP